MKGSAGSRLPRALRRTVLVAILVAPAPAAVVRAEDAVLTVGVSRTMEDVILPGPELVAKPLSPDSSFVLRITATFAHGTDFRYSFEYYALEPGVYDLTSYLVPRDGSTPGGTRPPLPEIPVEVRSLLAPGQVTPSTPGGRELPEVGGYRDLLLVAGVVWVAVLVLLFVWRRRRLLSQEQAAPVVTLAERLRPLVEKAMRGELPREEHAQLERTLLAFWRDRLGLVDMDAAEAIREMKRHEEAGQLLRELERWLHRPGHAGEVDVAALLRPYAES